MDTNKQLEQILFPVVESVFHLLKIHRKVIFGNPAIVVQNMLSKAPEAFDAVDVIFGALVNERLAVAHGVVFAQPFQGVVAPEGIGVVHRTFSGLLPNDGHQLFLADMLHHSRIDLPITLQQAKYNVFALSAPSALTFASAPKVGLIHLYFAVELATLKLRHMIQGLAQSLVEAGDRLVIKGKVTSKAIRRLLLVETLDDGDLGSDLPQRLLFSTALASASDVTSRGLGYLKRATENTLSTLQKVGRTTENILLTIYHMGILTPHGYETH